MNVIHLLASIFAIIDHYTEAFSQILFCCNLPGNYK